MDYRYLKAFLLTAEHQSFTRAAELLQVAQSAVSRQVRLLEESVQSQLLIRSPQKVILTPAGERLFQQARRFDQWVNEDYLESRPSLRIGTLPGVLENWLIRQVEKYHEKDLPNLNIHIGTSDSLVEKLENGEIDIALLSEQVDSELLSSRKLFEEQFVLVSKSRVDPKRLHEYRWISAENGTYLNRLSRKKSPRTIFVNSVAATLRLVESGYGIAVVPTHMLSERYRLKQTPITRIKGAIYLCLPNYQLLPDEIKKFIRTVSEA